MRLGNMATQDNNTSVWLLKAHSTSVWLRRASVWLRRGNRIAAYEINVRVINIEFALGYSRSDNYGTRVQLQL